MKDRKNSRDMYLWNCSLKRALHAHILDFSNGFDLSELWHFFIKNDYYIPCLYFLINPCRTIKVNCSLKNALHFGIFHFSYPWNLIEMSICTCLCTECITGRVWRAGFQWHDSTRLEHDSSLTLYFPKTMFPPLLGNCHSFYEKHSYTFEASRYELIQENSLFLGQIKSKRGETIRYKGKVVPMVMLYILVLLIFETSLLWPSYDHFSF